MTLAKEKAAQTDLTALKNTDNSDDTLPGPQVQVSWGRYECVVANGQRYRYESALHAEGVAARLRSFGWKVQVRDRAPSLRYLLPHQPDLFD